jgi:DNA-binding MarR family transcriptional regulator
MAKSRAQLIQQLNQAVQRQGTLTVLFTHAIAQHIGLSATEFEFCDVLRSNGPTTAGHLAKLCGLSTGGVTGIVDRLEKIGMVRRTTDPADRRKVIIEQTPWKDHMETVGRLYAPLSQAFNELAGTYSVAELSTVLDFMNRSTDMVESLRAKMAENKT